jgi:hypothetical protein
MATVKQDKICPLSNDACTGTKCAWFGKDNCSVCDIAIFLETIMRTLPKLGM